jgi:PAS domain S-box-containing protein
VAYFDARWQSPETLLAIFDQISDSVFFFDKNLLLVNVNPSGEKLFGLSAADMLGKPSWALFHVAASEQDPNYSAHVPIGTLTLFDNGRQHRVLVRKIELLDEAGRLEGVVAIVTDLTERALEHDLDINGHPAAPKSHYKFHPIVIRNRRVAAALGILLLLLLLVPIAGIHFSTGKQLTPEENRLAVAEKEKREATASFNAMTPAQHLERARLALRPGTTSAAIQDALRHLKVIPPSSAEAARARTLQKDLTRAGSLARAQTLIDASSSDDVRQGMEKLRLANVIIETVRGQYPNDSGASELSRQALAAAEQLAMRYPQDFAAAETKLVNFTWEKGGFGTVMIADFTVRNDSPVDVADLKIRCEHYAASGVVLDQNSGTAFALVRAHATTRIPNVNMGFLNAESGNSRTTKTDCEILGFKLASESQALSSTR